MTQEKFERACEIKASIDTIMELQDLLANSTDSLNNGIGKRCLAAIDVDSFDPSGYVIEDCNILNHINVPHKIMEQFNSILEYELNILKEEFETL